MNHSDSSGCKGRIPVGPNVPMPAPGMVRLRHELLTYGPEGTATTHPPGTLARCTRCTPRAGSSTTRRNWICALEFEDGSYYPGLYSHLLIAVSPLELLAEAAAE